MGDSAWNLVGEFVTEARDILNCQIPLGSRVSQKIQEHSFEADPN